MKWIFTTELKGEYTSVDPLGKCTIYSGLSMYLGAQEGKTPEKAFNKLYNMHGLKHRLPDIHNAVIYAFEVNHTGVRLDLNKSLESKNEEKQQLPKSELCEWCKAQLPPNGAAKFSHLKKHINELVKKHKLTQEQANSIRKLKLESEVRKIFEEYYNKKAIHNE